MAVYHHLASIDRLFLSSDVIYRYPAIKSAPLTKDCKTRYAFSSTWMCGEGLFTHIGLSELNADSIRRAHAIHPIASVEIEYNPFALEIEHNNVLATCKELGIAIIAYSPFSRGFFTGALRKREDLPEGDIRLRLDRFSEANFHKNLDLVAGIEDLAKQVGLTGPQLTLVWELHQYERMIPIPGTTRIENLRQNIEAARHEVPKIVLDQYRELADGAYRSVSGARYTEYLDTLCYQ